MEIAVDAAGYGHQVIGSGRLAGLHNRKITIAFEADYQLMNDLRAFLFADLLEVAIEAFPGHVFRVARSVAAIDGRDSLFFDRTLDFDNAGVHVQNVGVDASLHDGRGQVDSFCGQHLHQRLGYYAAAVVAAGWSTVCEVARFVDINTDVEIDGVSKAEKEVREERPGGSAADHRHA